MSENKISAELRTTFGKGVARKLRVAGKVPAVIYGHGTDPVHISLPAHEVGLIIRKANAILELDIEGKSQLALVKDVQRDPVRLILEHLDLLVVKKGEKVVVDIAVAIEGESASGTQVLQESTTISVEAEAMHIPTSITISVAGLEEGTQILAGEVSLPKGVSLIGDAESLLVNIVGLNKAVAESDSAEAVEAETE